MAEPVVSNARLESYQHKVEYRDEMLRRAIAKLDYWRTVRLSYSSWRNYKQCPLKGVLSQTYVVPGAPKPTLVVNFRGQVVHMVMDMVLERSRKEPQVLLSDEAFLSAIPLAWKIVEQECEKAPVDWPNEMEKVLTRTLIEETIKRSYPLLRESPEGTRILRLAHFNQFETEKRFKTQLTPKLAITGKIDLYITTPEEVVVVDYKDGKKSNTDWRQLAFYLIPQLELGKDCRGAFLFTSLGEWAWKDLTPKRWQGLKCEIQETVDIIEQRDFQAKFNQHLCVYCDFTSFCPEYGLKQGLSEEHKKRMDSLPDGEFDW